MARALIVGCGCHGRALGRALVAEGWQVRGSTRDPANAPELEAAGIEALVADPDRLATLVEGLEGVAVVFWLLGRADGSPDSVAALHGHRLERMLETIVDTGVRGFVYEASAGLSSEAIIAALELLRHATLTWRIPVEVVDADRERPEEWLEAMTGAARELIAV